MVVEPPKVFISYSHDSRAHEERTLALSERLRSDGVDAQLDQYVSGTPQEGWPRWMLNQLDWAEFVLLVCTETYYRRFRGHEAPGIGKGVDWEGNLVTAEMYDLKSQTPKFVPIFFSSEGEQFVPEPFRGHTRYQLDSEDNYSKLFAFLTGQAGVRPRKLGGSLFKLSQKLTEPLRFNIHNLPFPQNPAFLGRDSEMKDLYDRFQADSGVATTQSIAIHGLGGVGKTQLAVEYAWKHLSDYDAVLWVNANSPDALDASLAALASLLLLPASQDREQAVQVRAVLGWLVGQKRWLLIVDNADSESAAGAVRDRFQPNLRGHILITSRLSRWPVTMPDLQLDVFLPEDATRFLVNRVAEVGQNAGDEAAAEVLARELGGLPLALEQAAAFIIEMRWSYDKYCDQFRAARPELLSYRAEGGTRYPASVAKTWSMTLEQLSTLAHALLRLASWLAPDDIPRGVFSADQNIFAEAVDEDLDFSALAIDKALGELARFSLIRLFGETISVHRLVQAVEQDSLNQDERKCWLEWACRVFDAFAPKRPDDFRSWGAWLPLSAHAETLIENARLQGLKTMPVATVAREFGLFMNAQAEYSKAEAFHKLALAILEESLGPDHPNVAAGLSNLSRAYEKQGKYAQAQPLYQRALAISEKVHGPEHPDVATALNNLALLCQAQGRYADAEPLYQRALLISRKSPGPDADVGRTLQNLALLYWSQGKYIKAEPLYRRALPILEKAHGPNDPHVATALNNLALLYWNQGEYSKAEPLYRRAAGIMEKAFGPDHPDVATILNCLAGLYQAQGRYVEAEPILLRGLAIRKKMLGPYHQDVATSLNNLAALHQAQGQYEEAEAFHRQALEIMEKVVGSNHPTMRAFLNNLARTYYFERRYAEAEQLCQKAIRVMENALVPQHPDMAQIYGNLAEIYQAQGLHDKAESVRQQALSLMENTLGLHHPDVALSSQSVMLPNPTQTFAERPAIRQSKHKIGRNDFCPCGSGKKYKRCCGKSG